MAFIPEFVNSMNSLVSSSQIESLNSIDSLNGNTEQDVFYREPSGNLSERITVGLEKAKDSCLCINRLISGPEDCSLCSGVLIKLGECCSCRKIGTLFVPAIQKEARLSLTGQLGSYDLPFF